MKKYLLILTCLVSIVGTLWSKEYFFNGGFELDSYYGIKIKSSGATLVNSSYGKSLFLGEVFSGLEIQAVKNSPFSGEIDSNKKVFPYCTFELKLDPKASYDLSFDYMPGNIRNNGGFIITDSNNKVLRQRVLPVNNLDWNNVQIPFKFLPNSDGKISLKFFLKSAANLGGMAIDNVSIRVRGNLLPRWGSGNILNNKGCMPGWFWQVSNLDTINGDGFTVKSTSKKTVTVEVKTPDLMPDKEYSLRLGGKADKTISAVVEITFLNSMQQITGKTVVFKLKSPVGKSFRRDWRFSLPQDTMLVHLTVKYQLGANTTAFLNTPRVFLAPKLKK